MKRYINIAFLLCVLIVIAIPLVNFNHDEKVSVKEKRNLCESPKIVKDGEINGDYFSDVDAFLKDRFGGRESFIDIADISENMFGAKRHNEKAVMGKDGFYFYRLGGNDKDFSKENLLTPEKYELIKQNVKATVDWCNENGIKYVYLICPNKHSVYEDLYPFERPEGITRADQFTQIFDEVNANYVFSREHLKEKRKTATYPVYVETDTHWSGLGAFYTFELLFEKIKGMFPNHNFPFVDCDTLMSKADTLGDILPFLGVRHAESTHTLVYPKAGNYNNYFTYLYNNESELVVTESLDKTLPRAIIYRDSYGCLLVGHLSPLFSHAEYYWKQFSLLDRENLLKNKPDLLIFEMVEREAFTEFIAQ